MYAVSITEHIYIFTLFEKERLALDPSEISHSYINHYDALNNVMHHTSSKKYSILGLHTQTLALKMISLSLF